MVVCGPFTVNNELSFEALKDIMAKVKQDQPHSLIMTGPFLNQAHEDIQSGDLRYRHPLTGEMNFLDYQGLFEELMNFIYDHIPENTQLVIVPSTNEIQHIYPLPQPQMSADMFANTKMRKANKMPILASNPCFIQLNDIKVGIIN